MTLPPQSRVVDVEGSGYDRGVAHGESLRPVVAEALERWRYQLQSRHHLGADEFVRQFLGGTGYRDTVERLSPDLADEVRGIAAGADQPVDDVWAYNFMDEEWGFKPTAASTGCSVVAMPVETADGPAILLAQNMDLPVSMDGSQAVLRIRQDDAPDQIVATAAGLVGLVGANSAGLGLCVNTLLQLDRSTDGLPVAFVVREVIRQASAGEAASFLTSVAHASGQHYVVADPSVVRGFECSAGGCVEGPPSRELLHTNHPLWSSHLGRRGPGGAASVARDANSRARYAALAAGAKGVRESGTARDLLARIDVGLCVVPSEGNPSTTFLSVEYVLSTPPRVAVTFGRPDTAPWTAVDWMVSAV